MTECCVIIPAVKKNVAFPDDLIKKLDGIPLIQRAINQAKKIKAAHHTCVVTDSEEIALICERNAVGFFRKSDLNIESPDIIKTLRFFLVRLAKRYHHMIILWPYAPLVNESDILNAYTQFCDHDCDIMVTLREEHHRVFTEQKRDSQSLVKPEKERFLIEMRAFMILDAGVLFKEDVTVHPYILNEKAIEIQSYQDWWICEKLLQRKRMVFRVIGNEKIGMGHIYRALTLAHEISDHEIIFVCDEQDQIAVHKIAGADYYVIAVPFEQLEEKIIALRPDIVINDALNTSCEYIQALKQHHIRTVSFEDLGPGASYTDVTFNEIYSKPQKATPNIRWGYQDFFLRDEFEAAAVHKFSDPVSSVLITFGGTDPNNFTKKILTTVVDFL